MNELYEQLFQRWVRAFDEFDSLSKYRFLVRTKKYATIYRYEVRDYTPQSFPAGGAIYDEKTPDASSIRIYGLDGAGRPVHMSAVSDVSGVFSEGYYSYSESVVEYLEFSKSTTIPDRMEIMMFDRGKKTAYLRFIVSGVGNIVPGGSIEAYIEEMRRDPRDIICQIEQYIYEGERITGADCFAITPGIGPYSYKQVYTYDNKGQLDEIRSVFGAGHHRLEYVRLSGGTNVQALADELAVLMADAVVETLLKNNVNQPLALLELSYQNVGNYLPYLEFKTVADRDELFAQYGEAVDFEQMFISTYDNMIPVEDATFERQLQQLMQIMEQQQDYEIGTTMLRKAGRLLTKGRLNGKIPVSEDFVAYPIEWMLESQQFEEILRACGQSEEIISDWKERGWL
jgi:hypothetical protein